MNIIETIQKNNIIKVLLILGVVYFFMKYYNQENLDNTGPSTPSTPSTPVVLVQSPTISQGQVSLSLSPANSQTNTIQQQQIDSIVAGPTQLTTSDLLPKYDDASDFAKQNPVSKILQEQNFLQAGYHIGINTQMQSNKIPYLDVRSCPPIPKQEAGPWNQSSFEEPAGAKRRHLEIGS